MNSKTNCIGRIFFVSVTILTFSVVSVSAQVDQSAGKTIMARGDVNASNQDSGQRALVRRSPVYMVDNVTTGQLSATQLRMIDGGLLSLQETTELAIVDYEFDAESQQGSVNMSLLKGGLRTVTGALQSDQNNYRLKTPIASIGVRGTHYEAELFEGDLYLAGWEGTIDISVDATNYSFSLGPKEDFRFAIVRSDGSVEFLLAAPFIFTDGHSNDLIADATLGELPNTFSLVSARQGISTFFAFEPVFAEDTYGETFIDNDRLVSRILPDPQGIMRTGSATYSQLTNSDFISTAGAVSDLNVSITVNFTTSSIPSGNLSFNDANGEWFAVFNGLIDANQLDLNVNFASHNNNLADGFIDALLIDNATSILGNVSLFEINQPAIQAGGSFELTITDQIP